MLIEMVQVLEDCKGTNLLNKSVVSSMMTTFAEVLVDVPEFHKMLADPKTDLKQLEPIIKKMIKNKKKK